MTQDPRLIIEIFPFPGSPLRRYVTVEKFPFTIGRGFGNDLILEDPHISPEHLRLDWNAERGWSAADLGSDNGLFINSIDLSRRSVTLSPGDEITIGRTRFRLVTPAHPVAKTLPMPRAHGVLSVLAKPFNALVYFFIAVMGLTLWFWLEVWSSDEGMTIIMLVLSTVLIILIWSGIWALAGRIIRHKSGFFEHLTLSSTYVLLSALAYCVLDYADFLNSGGKFSAALEYGVNFILAAGLIFGALGLSCEMPHRKRKIAALLFAGGLTLGSLGISIVGSKSFSPEPEYPWGLKPYLSSWARAESPEAFMVSSDRIFENAALKIKKKKNASE